MKVFLICENIDLGYHVVRAFSDQNNANNVCEEMNKLHLSKTIDGLITHCGYSEERAKEYANRSAQYYVEEIDCE